MKSVYYIVVIAVVSLLFGCEQDNDLLKVNNPNPAYNTGDASETSDTNNQSGNEKPTYGGTLNISMRIPKTLNPLINEDITVDNALKPVFETLFKVDNTGKVTPNIAESYSFTNDILTIKIKDGLRWHNGTAITAKDVIFSLNTIKSQGEKCLYSNALKNVTSFIDNGNSVTIKLSKPYYYSIYNLCFPVISADYYNGKTAVDSDVSMNPIGSGSFKFSSYQLARRLVLEKCQGINGSPYIDKISITITNDRQTDLYAFEQSITDVIQSDMSEWGKYSASKKINISEFDTNNFECLGYNHKNPVLSNITVRQAISKAVPSDEIVESIYLNHGIKTHIPVNPNAWFYAKETLIPPKYNLEEAAKTIKATGLTKDRLNFSILVNSENKSRCEAAAIIADRLNQIGFNITVNRQPFDKFIDLIKKDSFDMFLGGIKLSKSGELRPLLSSEGITTGINYFNYSSQQLDNLILKVESATSDDTFKASQAELQKFIESQIPFTGICLNYSAVLTSNNVNGEKNPTMGNIYNDIHKWYINNKTEEVK